MHKKLNSELKLAGACAEGGGGQNSSSPTENPTKTIGTDYTQLWYTTQHWTVPVMLLIIRHKTDGITTCCIIK